MEKSQAYIIATAIVVAGLIVAAAVLVHRPAGRYVPWTDNNAERSMLDTQTGTVWALNLSTVQWRSVPLPWYIEADDLLVGVGTKPYLQMREGCTSLDPYSKRRFGMRLCTA